MANQKLISIIVPVYNESEGIEAFHTNLLSPSINKLTAYQFEILYIDDGSRDNSLIQLRTLSKSDSRIRVIALSRNFGKELAITAGISQAVGDAIIMIDSDGQHPPALIADFIKKWDSKNGPNVVIGVRKKNSNEGMIKKYGSKVFYRVLNKLSVSKYIPGATDFRLIDKLVAEEFLQFSENNRMARALIDWLGFKRDYIDFDSPARFAGKPTYNVSKLVVLALDSFVSLSIKPLLYLMWTGIAVVALSFFAIVFIGVEQLLLGDPLGLNVTGSGGLGLFISLLVGIVLLSQGIVAMYVAHIHTHAQKRPLFVINKKESIGLFKK